MNTQVKRDIIAAALANPTEEVCGLIVYGRNVVRAIPCPNIATEDRAHTFEISDQDYIAATHVGIPCGLYHSHPYDSTAFSEEDLAVATELELPSHVVSLLTGVPEWSTYIPPTYRVPEVGSEFAWGERDCYETIRIHYRQELSLYLPDFERDMSFRDLQSSAILDHVADAGFVLGSPDWNTVQLHDVLVFNTDNRRFPHHLAVFVGKSRMLHHPFGGLSQVSNIDGEWLDKLVGVGRHTSRATPVSRPRVSQEVTV